MANVKHSSTFWHIGYGYQKPVLGPVSIEGHQPVHKVVFAGYAAKHPPNMVDFFLILFTVHIS
jgi:hypothetical protein